MTFEKESKLFEEWAQREGYVMDLHLLHYLFLDSKTYAARQGWKAALEAVAAPAHPDSVRLDWLERRRIALNQHYGTSYGWKFVASHNVNRLFVRDVNTIDLNDAEARAGNIREAIDKAMAAASIGKSDDERRICIHKPEVLTADGTVICKRCGERIRLAWGDTWILDESVTRPTTERTR